MNENKVFKLQLKEFITASRLTNVVKGVKELSRESESPQLAISLRGHIKQLCLLKESIARRNDNPREKQDAKDFLKDYNTYWNAKVTAVANRTRQLQKLNKTEEIPSTEDLVTLNEFLTTTINDGSKTPKPSYPQYVELAQAVIARVAVFNMRRIAEVNELKVVDFDSRKRGNELGSNQEIINSLDVTEKALLKRYFYVPANFLSRLKMDILLCKCLTKWFRSSKCAVCRLVLMRKPPLEFEIISSGSSRSHSTKQSFSTQSFLINNTLIF